jgi:hypothetical protein
MMQLYLEDDVFPSKNSLSIVWLLVLMRSIITIVMLLGFLYVSLRSMLELKFRRANAAAPSTWWANCCRNRCVAFMLSQCVISEVRRASCWTVSEALRLLFVLIVELRCEVRTLFTILTWIEIWSQLTRENLITVLGLSIMVYMLPELLDAVKDIPQEKRHASR